VDPKNVTTKDIIDSAVNTTLNVDPRFALDMVGTPARYCHKWPVRAVERFRGPWNHTLPQPILIIGNQADPATPFANAKTVAEALGDSAVLLEQEGYGHTSFALPSVCTRAVVVDYFTNGKVSLPKEFYTTWQC
jgi:hypothetical protein